MYQVIYLITKLKLFENTVPFEWTKQTVVKLLWSTSNSAKICCINLQTCKSNSLFNLRKTVYRNNWLLVVRAGHTTYLYYNQTNSRVATNSSQPSLNFFEYIFVTLLVFTFILMKLWLKLCFIFWLFEFYHLVFINFIVF